MIAVLLFLSALLFIPGAGPLVDAYDLPKTAAVGALAACVWIGFYLRMRDGEHISFPLAGPIAALLAVSALSWLGGRESSFQDSRPLNTHYFLYALGAQLAGFTFFFYGTNLTPRSFSIVGWIAPVVVVAAYALTPWLGIATTFGNQERGSALAALAVGICLWLICHPEPFASCHPERSEGSQFAQGRLREGSRFFAALRMTIVGALLASLLMFLRAADMRSASIGLLIGLVAWLWMIRQRFLVALALGLFAAAGDSVGAISYLFRPDSSERRAIWEQALRLDWWPLGIGLGQWRLYAQAWIHDPEFGAGYLRELHNDYIQLLVETGPLALAAWVYLLWRVLSPTSNVQRPRSKVQSPLVVGLIAVMVNAFFLFPFQLPIEAAWFWLVAGVHAGGRREA